MEKEQPILFLIEQDAADRAALSRLLVRAAWPVRTYAGAQAFALECTNWSGGCLVIGADRDFRAAELLEMRDEAGLPPAAVVLAGKGDVATAVRALKAGALDVLTKPVDFQSLSQAVGRGMDWAARAGEHRRRLCELRLRVCRLTPREKEVFALVVSGLLNKQIAAELGATERTIKAHRSRVMEKCEVDSLAELVHMADVIELHAGGVYRLANGPGVPACPMRDVDPPRYAPRADRLAWGRGLLWAG